jgi:uncharacterized protein YukE
MQNSSQVPVEELNNVHARIQSLMDDVNAVIMNAQHENDHLIGPNTFSGLTAMASQAKAAQITEAGQNVKNNLIALGENLGMAAQTWQNQAEEGMQAINSVEV